MSEVHPWVPLVTTASLSIRNNAQQNGQSWVKSRETQVSTLRKHQEIDVEICMYQNEGPFLLPGRGGECCLSHLKEQLRNQAAYCEGHCNVRTSSKCKSREIQNRWLWQQPFTETKDAPPPLNIWLWYFRSQLLPVSVSYFRSQLVSSTYLNTRHMSWYPCQVYSIPTCCKVFG